MTFNLKKKIKLKNITFISPTLQTNLNVLNLLNLLNLNKSKKGINKNSKI